MDIKKVADYNIQQITHVELVQRLVWRFCQKLMNSALSHDFSKFSEKEYGAFLDSRESLNASKDGKDEGYQKHLNSEGIQHHIKNNSHHPEYWDEKGEEMPLEEAVNMYFDWCSRCIQRSTDMKDFWDHNTAKLKKQPRALAVVELLNKYMDLDDLKKSWKKGEGK